jgi:5-methylcytosine-specific restriction enzyme subunit McrC
MNDLWEEYIYRQILKHSRDGFSVRAQNSKHFWRLENSSVLKTVRPDIVINTSGGTIVLDTKWKLPDGNVPADADLKQMFVYNEYWTSKHAILLYPSPKHSEKVYHKGSFVPKVNLTETHDCGVMRISILDEANESLDKRLGQKICGFLNEQIEKYLQ